MTDAVFSADGTLVLTGGSDAMTRVSDAESGRPAVVLRGAAGPVKHVAFSPNGRRVLSTDDRNVHIYPCAFCMPAQELQRRADRLIMAAERGALLNLRDES